MDPIAQRLMTFDACALADALDTLGLPGVVTGWVVTLPGKRIAGPVRTCRLADGAAPAGAPVRHLGAASIDAAAQGDVIVVSASGTREAGCWGGVLSRAAQRKGIAAVIADGLLRDVGETREMGFPVFCRGFTAFTARGRLHEAAVDVPLSLGAARVEPGDYVLADCSACVFISPKNIPGVLEAAARIAAREREMIQRIDAGERASDVLGARYEHMLERPKR